MKQFFKKIFGKREERVKQEEVMVQPEKTRAAVDDFDCDPEKFHDLLQKRPAMKLIDVRAKEEYEEGHIENAQLLPVQELTQERIDALGVEK